MLFAGSDGGAEHWAIIASLVETCKLNDVDPLAYLPGALTRIVNGHPNSDIDQLLPWAYCRQDLNAVAREQRSDVRCQGLERRAPPRSSSIGYS
ncbi:transposase domain-containing protein [Bradyrhizobium quebecense]|nr:transposase domain-containing protein [Bradyrhizobium quebecense]